MTIPVFVVRHAEAGDRERWTGPDARRPLTDGGDRQAEALVVAYAPQPFRRLLSSPSRRCVQTLEPLARDRDLSIEIRSELAEGMPHFLVEKLAQEVAAEGPGALCVHGDALDHLIDDLAERGVELGHDPPFDLRKGTTWVLEIQEGSIVAALCIPAPTGGTGLDSRHQRLGPTLRRWSSLG